MFDLSTLVGLTRVYDCVSEDGQLFRSRETDDKDLSSRDQG